MNYFEKLKTIITQVINWKWDKIANIMVVIGIFIAILTFFNSNKQFKENIKLSQQLYKKDSILFEKQLALSQEPIVRISSDNGAIKGKEEGLFSITLKNSGISDIQNIEIFDEYFVAHKPKNGQITMYIIGTFTTISQNKISSINSKDSSEFNIDFRDLKERISDTYSSLKGEVMRIARLTIRYERKVDSKKFEFKKVLIIGGGDVLIDLKRDISEASLPGSISLNDVKSILGVN